MVIGGVGSKEIKDWDFVEEHLERGEVIFSNLKNAETHQERFEEFLNLKRITKSLSHSLAKTQNLIDY